MIDNKFMYFWYGLELPYGLFILVGIFILGAVIELSKRLIKKLKLRHLK